MSTAEESSKVGVLANRQKDPKSRFKQEIRDGYLWMSRAPVLRKIMTTPGRNFGTGGVAAHAWGEFLDWMKPEDSVVKINERRLAIMMEVSRQSVNAYNMLDISDRADATSHRNLLFMATRTPPIPSLDEKEVITAEDVFHYIRKYQRDDILVAWKSRQIIEKYDLPKTSMWFDAEIDARLTLRGEEPDDISDLPLSDDPSLSPVKRTSMMPRKRKNQNQEAV